MLYTYISHYFTYLFFYFLNKRVKVKKCTTFVFLPRLFVASLVVVLFPRSVVDGGGGYQGLLLGVAVLDGESLRARLPQQESDRREEDEVVVYARPDEQNGVADGLEVLEVLPAHDEREGPDEDGPDAVQDHSGGGAHLLRDGQSGEVKESDADDETDVGEGQLPVVGHLDDAVYGIFKARGDLPEVESGREMPRDEEHGEEEDEEDGEAEDSLPADPLEWWDLQAGKIKSVPTYRPTDGQEGQCRYPTWEPLYNKCVGVGWSFILLSFL